MKVSVFGLGYVGCVGMACMAEHGLNVVGVDIDDGKVDLINRGISPIIERGISEGIRRHAEGGRISATKDGVTAVLRTDVTFLCVGTPSGPNGHTDTAALWNAAREVAEGIKDKTSFHVVVIRSTVPPGTNARLGERIERLSGRKLDVDFAVVSNPEFLREGTAVRDYNEPPFTLAASTSDEAIAIVGHLYKDIDAPFIRSEVGVAELIKYVNNAFHALKITFANEIGAVAKKINVDSHALMDVFCRDAKLNLSPYYLKPGFAYGGSCLPKDLRALKIFARDLYVDCPVIESIDRSNELRKSHVIERVLAHEKRRIGVLGLSFKAGTDDLRNSPVVDVIETLIGKGFHISVYDKSVNLSKLIGANKQYILQKVPMIAECLIDDPLEAMRVSELVLVVNSEPEYAEVLEKLPAETPILDLVNIQFRGRQERAAYEGLAW